jgi:hypothetical protein
VTGLTEKEERKMKRRAQIFRFRLLWPAVALLIGLTLALTAMSAIAVSASPVSPEETPGGIQGTLYAPDGTTPSGGWIDIRDAAGQPWMGADANPADGSFSIPNLPAGTYILRAYPPPGSPHAASVPRDAQVLSGQWTSLALRLTEVRISGYVRDCDAIPEQRIEGATVAAHRNDEWVWDSTNANGEFKLGGLDIGVPYTLEAFPPPESEYAPLEPIMVVPISTGVILEMCIPPINVAGIVNDPAGNPVDGAWVVIWNDFHSDETSAELGNFHFRGLPLDAGNVFWIHAGPPWGAGGTGLISSEPFTIAVPTPPLSATVVITLPYAPKTVTGHVYKLETPPTGVPDAEIHARRLDGPGFAGTATDPTGAFTLSLTGGEWHLAVRPSNPPTAWVWPGPPAWVVFAQDTTPQAETVDFEVIPTNAWVEGRVVCPGGNPCRGDPPHDAMWVELRHDEIGNGAGLGPDYRFSIPIPDGWYELAVHVDDPLLQGPGPVPVFVGPGQTLDVGDIALLLRDARIIGQVRNETGAGVAGVPVVGWQPQGVGWGRAETDASGFYTMPVIGGEWFVEPQPGPEIPFVFSDRPRFTRVAPGGTMTGVDFRLNNGGARIEGAAVDEGTSARIWGLDGSAWAERIVPPPDDPVFYSDAPMWDGGFELKVTGDEAYWVGVEVPPHAPYVSGGTANPVEVPPAGHVPIAVPLEHKNAAIGGRLIDVLTNLPPTRPIWAEVFGEDERGHWVVVGVNPSNAMYELGVVSGTWHLRAWVDPESRYVAVPTPTVVAVQSHQVASPVNLEVYPIEASISGQVQEPDGTPLPGAFVFAEGESPFVGHFETHAESDELGNFELLVPEGGYVVGAALPGDELEARGWLNPRPIDVPWVSASQPATGQDLRFRRLDGEIHGTITFAPGIVATPTHPAYVWGWADSGEWAETEATVVPGTDTFTYTMRVVSDTVWHVGAVYEDWDNGLFYESPEETVPGLQPSGQAVQDLELGGPWALPQPFIVSFDGAQMQTIILPDGMEIVIPPRALVDSGTVTLFIFPTQELRPEPGHEIVGPGYKMWAVDQNGQQITQFNKRVIMTFHYPPDADLAWMGISEHLLVPVYYSTLVGHWILADSYVVDTVHNEITLQISHFTKFGLMSTGPAEKWIYLPLVLRNLGG